ncbi:MAG TPA: TolC family protein [Polyangiaceae bacterium]
MRTPRLMLARVLFSAAAATLATANAAAQESLPPPSPRTTPPAQRVLVLVEVERSALQVQPLLLAARANTNVALALAEQQRAPLLPQVIGSAAYTRETANIQPRPGFTSPTGTPTAVVPGGSLFSTSYDYFQFGITATQLIYDFGQTSNKYDAAKLNAESQRYAEQTTRLTILLNVRRAYFAARANKELVDVAKETLDDQNKHLAQVQGMVTVGTQPPIALAQQKAAVANAVVQIIQAQNNYETSKAQLNQAAGMPGGTEYDVSDQDMPVVSDEDQPLETLMAKAVAARPEIATLIKQHDAAEATLSSAKGTYGPSIGAIGSVTDYGTNLGQLVPDWAIGVTATWPLFQGGLTKGLVHQADANIEYVDSQKAVEELQVRLDVDSARLAVRAAKATTGAVEDALTSAREQLRLAEQRYATGVGNIIELNDAQVAYTTAAAQVVSARYTLATARAQFLAAMGRT